MRRLGIASSVEDRATWSGLEEKDCRPACSRPQTTRINCCMARRKHTEEGEFLQQPGRISGLGSMSSGRFYSILKLRATNLIFTMDISN